MPGVIVGPQLGFLGNSGAVPYTPTIGSPQLGTSGETVDVNAYTGNLVIQSQDEYLTGVGLDDSVSNTYNSLGTTPNGWLLSTGEHVTGTVGGSVTLTNADGSTALYSYSGSSGYVQSGGPAIGAKNVLSYSSTTQLWTLTYPDGHTQSFDQTNAGRLVRESDLNGNSLTYGYNGSGLISSITSSDGDVVYFDYTNGLVSDLRTVTTQNGVQSAQTQVYYGYDSSNRLTTVTVDLSPSDNSISDHNDYVTTYGYQGTTNLVSSISQTDGTSVAVTYTTVNGVNEVASIAQIVGGVARTTTFSYGYNKTTVTDPLGLVTTLSYITGQGLTKITGPAINGTSQVESFAYNGSGQDVGNFTDASGNTTTISRVPANGSLSEVRDSFGNETTYAYSTAPGLSEELVSSTTYTSGSSGGQTTYYIYDSNRNLRFTISPSGRVTEIRYNALGEPTSKIQYSQSFMTTASASTTLSTMVAWSSALATQAGAQRTDYTYDYRGNVASTTSYSVLEADGTGSVGQTSEVTKVLYVYDQAGRLLQKLPIQESPAQAETYTYDGLGRVLTATDLYGNVTARIYSDATNTVTVTMANGLVKTSHYDQAGELIGEVDSSAGTTISSSSNAYDADGRLALSTDPSGLTTYYLYDEAGRKVGQIAPNGLLTETVYTANNLVAQSISYATAVNPSAIAALTSGGVPVGKVLVGGVATAMTLNNSGVRPAASALDRKSWNFYDSANRLIETVDGVGAVTTFTYNGDSQLIAETQYATPLANFATFVATPTIANAAPTASSSTDRTSHSFYDSDGNLTATVDGEGYATQYIYNAAGQLTATTKYSTKVSINTGNPFVAPTATPSDIHTYNFYDGRGLLTSSIDGDGYVTNFSYDEYGNLIRTIQGTQINAAALSSPQSVAISFTATGAAYNGTWPSVSVYVDGVLQGSVSISSTTATLYTVSAANVTPLAEHTIDLVLTNSGSVAGQGPSFSYSNAKFGATTLSINGQAAEFTAGIASTAIQHVGAAVTSASPTISVNGASSWTVDAAQVANTWGTVGTVLQETDHTYNAYGKLLTTTRHLATGTESDSVTYDANWDVTSSTNVDRTQSFRYDLEGRVIAQMGGDGSAALANLPGNATAAQIQAVWTQYATTFAYDPAGQKISSTDPLGNKTLYFYSALGTLADSINALGDVTSYQYDEFGDLTQTTVFANRLAGTTFSGWTGGLVTPALTTALGQLASPTFDTVTKASFGNNGLLASTTDALQFQTTDLYNAFGELSSQVTPGPTGATSTDTYDRRGLQTSQSVTSAGTTLSTSEGLDAFGRVVSKVDANGNTSSIAYDQDSNALSSTDGLGQSTALSYDAFGNVLSKTDARGLVTHFAYSPFNRTVTTTSPDGFSITVNYNAHGQETSLVDGDGNTTSYTYDQDGNLLKTVLLGPSVDIVTQSTFDPNDRVSSTTDADGNQTNYTYDAANRVLTEVVDPGTGHLNLTTTYVYNTRSQVTTVTDPLGIVTTYGYDQAGQKLNVTTDATGNNIQTEYTYDAEGRIVQQIEGYASASTRTTAFVYDGFGRLLKRIVDPGNLALTTTYTYDANGNVVAVTDANQNITRNVYNADNQLIYTVDALGDVTANSYDGDGNLVTTTKYATPVALSGLPTLVTAYQVSSGLTPSASADETTSYVYDGENRLRYTIDALGYVTERDLDANGNLLKQIQYANPISVSGTLSVAVMQAAISAQTLGRSPSNRSTTSLYDGDGRVLDVIDAAGYLTAYSYDGDGNVIGTTQYSVKYGGVVPATLSSIQTWLATAGSTNPSLDRTTLSYYDAGGRAVYVIDPLGYATQRSYDADGHILETIQYGTPIAVTSSSTLANVAALLPTSPPATAVTKQYVYDTAGRQIESIDGNGVVTQQTLNTLGQVVRLTQALNQTDQTVTVSTFDTSGRLKTSTKAYNTAAAQTTSYTYDNNGNALSITNGRGYVTTQTFDALNRRTSVSAPLTATASAVTKTTYDAFGNSVAVTDPNGNVGTFYFDQLNRDSMQVDPLGFVTVTQYDAFGDPSMVAHYANAVQGGPMSPSVRPAIVSATPNPVTVPYVVTNISQDAVTYLNYDHFGRLISSTDATANGTSYTYDAFGDRVTETNALGGTTTYTYDQRGEQTAVTLPVTSLNASGVAIPVVNQTFYDAFGNKIKTIEAVGLPEVRTTTFTYDKDGRQLTQTSDTVAIFTTSAGMGSIAPVSSTAYDDLGRTISQTDADGNVTTFYYDAAGNKIAEVSPTGTLSTWSYDAAGNALTARVYGDLVSLPASTATPPAPVNAANYRETDYTYDESNRQVGTLISNVTLAARSAGESALQIYVGSIATATVYDADGNVIETCDGRGALTYYYYDANGNKIAQVDALNDLTVWTRDQNGNVLQQTQYDNRLSLIASSSLTVASMVANVGSTANDRITQYVYDKVGRVLSQSVLNVAASTVTGDSLVTAATTSTTSYTYDGLGDVVTQTAPDGDLTTNTYDVLGRKIEVQGAAITDYTGATVRPTSILVYNGLNLVTSETQRASMAGPSAADRTTTFAYGADGRLSSTAIGGTNVATNYRYDAAGNITQTYNVQVNASGVSQTDATNTTYDAAGRTINSATYSLQAGATSWTTLDSQQTQFDAYGEVIGQGANGGAQVYMQYDNAGRVWKTNSSDGSCKVYLYDENGNETVLIKSAGANLAPLSLTQIIEISEATTPADPAVQAAVAAGGTNITVNVYDALNRLTDSYTPALKSIDDLSALQQFVSESAAGQFSGGGILQGNSSLITKNVTTTAPTLQGTVTADAAQSATVTWNWSISTGSAVATGFGQASPLYTTPIQGESRITITMTIPPGLRNGGGSYLLETNKGATAVAANATSVAVSITSGGSFSAGLPYPNPFYGSNVASLYELMPDGSYLLVATSTWNCTAQTGEGAHQVQTTSTAPNLEIQSQSAAVTNLVMYVRVYGSAGAWQAIAVPKMLNSGGGPIAGWYSLNPVSYGLSGNTWQYMYVGMDSSGNIYNYEAGTMSFGATYSVSQAPQSIGGSGMAFETTDGVFQFSQMGANAHSAIIHYRPHGSTGAWTVVTVNAATINGIVEPGWFQLGGIGATDDVIVDTYTGSNGTGTQVNIVRGTLTPGVGAVALSSWASNPASSVYFNSEPASSSVMILTYWPQGNTSAATTITIPYTASQGFFAWDTAGIAPDGARDYLYGYSYQVWSSSNQEVNAAHGVVQVGLDFQMQSHINDPLPNQVVFNPPESSATTMTLQYRAAGSTGSYTTVTLTKNAIGLYLWDVDSIRPAFGTLALDYLYTLTNASGTVVAPINANEEQGSIEIDANGAQNASTVEWDITGLNNNPPAPGVLQAAAHTYQVYDALGDVIESVDGLGNATTMTYNTLGRMTSKALPMVSVTDQHGNVTSVNPTSYMYYDLSGRLVGSRDAGGNLTTYVNLAGYGDDGSAPKVVTQYNPDGSSTQNGYDIFGDLRQMKDGLGNITTEIYDQADRLITITRPSRTPGTPGYSSTGPNADTDTYTYDSHGNRITDTNALGYVTNTYFDAENRVIESIDGGGLVTSYAYSAVNVTGVNGSVTSGWQKTTTNPSGLTETDDTDYFGHLTLHTDFGGHTSTYSFNAAAEVTNETGSDGSHLGYIYYVNGAVEYINDSALNTQAFYEYDADGNVIVQTYSTIAATPAYYQDAVITYDADGRVTEFKDVGPDIKYAYDANGNRVEIKAVYADGVTGATDTQDYWYEYDSMNRFTLSMGALSAGNIVLGSNGVSMQYNADGERMEATYGSDGHTENYTYTTDGYLENTLINGVLRAQRSNDILGRVVNYYEYSANGKTVSYDDINQTYDKSNRLLSDQTNTLNGTAYTTVNESYGYQALNASAGTYTGVDMGVVTNETQKTVATGVTVTTMWTYAWWDSAQTLTIEDKGVDVNNPNTIYWAPGLSNFVYDVNGHLAQNIGYGAGQLGSATQKTINYVNDPYGQILSETEMDGPSGALVAGPKQHFYYLNGTQVGEIGTNIIAAQQSYEQTLVNGTPTSGAYAAFNSGFEAINTQYTASVSNNYTVANGDTLQTIAQKMWGDGSLWYLIADANGLSTGSSLTAGETLTIPNEVSDLHNNTSTYQVYNQQQAEGDVMPLLPPEPSYPPPPPPASSSSSNGCGGFGQILAIVVTVVVAVVLSQPEMVAQIGPALGLGSSGLAATVATGAVAGAVGSIAGQAVGIATGAQKGFSFTSVALGAVGGAIGGGIGQQGWAAKIASVTNGFVGGAVSSLAGSLATTAVEDVLGLPAHFSWAAIGAQALGAGVSAEIPTSGSDTVQSIEHGLISGVVTGAVAPGNLQQKLPEIIGNAVGQTIGSTIVGAQQAAAAENANTALREVNAWNTMLGTKDLQPTGSPGQTSYFAEDGSPWPSSDGGDVVIGGPSLTRPISTTWSNVGLVNTSDSEAGSQASGSPLPQPLENGGLVNDLTSYQSFVDSQPTTTFLAPLSVVGGSYFGQNQFQPTTEGSSSLLDDMSFLAPVAPDYLSRLDGLSEPSISQATGWDSALATPGPLKNQFNLMDPTNFPAYLMAVNQQVTSGAQLDGEDISRAKTILFGAYGYAMGSLRSSPDSQTSVETQLDGGFGSDMTDTFSNALAKFSQLTLQQQQERFGFYSNIQTILDAHGNPTNGRTVSVTQGDRTITINWSDDFANLANAVQVSQDEALRKTDFSVYQSVVSAAFGTDGLDSLTINGAWRPSKEDYQAVNGMTPPVGYPNYWKDTHVSADAVDINLLNGTIWIKAPADTYSPKTIPVVGSTAYEDPLITNFITSLEAQPNSRQIFSPWQMNSNIQANPTWGVNNGAPGNPAVHENHLHFGTNGT